MRSILLGSALFLVVAAPFALAGDHKDNEDNEACTKLLLEGHDLYEKREFEKALEVYQQAAKEDPKSCRALYMIGNCYGETHRWDDAIAAHKKSLELSEPGGHYAARSLYELANDYMLKGDFEKSIGYSRASIKLESDCWTSWRYLAVALERLGKTEEAMAACETSLKYKPDQPDLVGWLEEAKKHAKDPMAKKSIFETAFSVPAIGGWLAAQDLKTLIVAVPSRGELQLLDTTTRDEPKHVSLEFQPGRLAWQGKWIYATVANGAARVQAIDPETGKVQKTFNLPGDPVVEIACHPSKGLIYGATKTGEIVSIDPSSGRVAKTKAKGTLLAVDPAKGAFVYAAATDGKDADATALRKYAVQGADLKLVDTNANAAVRGFSLQLSPDGKRIAVVGEGFHGVKEELDPNAIAVFETESINSAAGRIDAGGRPLALAFHPLLDIGVVVCDRSVSQFHAKSFAKTQTWEHGTACAGRPGSVAFAGQGGKFILWQPGDVAKKEEGSLGVVPLKLTAEETSALEKALAKPR